MMTTKKYYIPARPARTVVRIPLGGKISSMQALLKEIKKMEVPTTAHLRVINSTTGKSARLEWPTNIAA